MGLKKEPLFCRNSLRVRVVSAELCISAWVMAPFLLAGCKRNSTAGASSPQNPSFLMTLEFTVFAGYVPSLFFILQVAAHFAGVGLRCGKKGR